VLQSRIRREALAVIAVADTLARWEEAGEELVAERRRSSSR